jgi:hypothetical protein
MTENTPSEGRLSTRQKIQLACAVALAAGIMLDYYRKPAVGSYTWMLRIGLMAVGGIVGLLTLLRRPQSPPER